MTNEVSNSTTNSGFAEYSLVGGRKKSPGAKKTTKKATAKKGGNLATDVVNLAVPFALLLAKQAVEAMFDKKKEKKEGKAKTKASSKTKSTKTKSSVKSAKSPAGVRRRTVAGGCGTTACAAGQSGGDIQFNELSAKIDNFLKNN